MVIFIKLKPGLGVLESSALLPSRGERLPVTGCGEGVPSAVKGEYCRDVSSDVVTVVVRVTAEAGVRSEVSSSAASTASVIPFLDDFSTVFRVGLGEERCSCGRLGSLRRRRTDLMLSASLCVSDESPVCKKYCHFFSKPTNKNFQNLVSCPNENISGAQKVRANFKNSQQQEK